MKATYYGHSAVALSFDGGTILFDPFITPNELAKDIDINQINPDYILLSHAHGDHVADLVPIHKQSNAPVIAIHETSIWLKSQDIAEDKIIGMNFGGTIRRDFFSAKMVYALHTNSTPDGNYAGLPAGYVIQAEGKKIYFAGDTGLTTEFQLLANLNLDWAILPIGGNYTLDVEEAIVAAKMINCKQIIGVHFDTFPPIKIDKESAVNKFEAEGLTLKLIPIGTSISL